MTKKDTHKVTHTPKSLEEIRLRLAEIEKERIVRNKSTAEIFQSMEKEAVALENTHFEDKLKNVSEEGSAEIDAQLGELMDDLHAINPKIAE